MQKKEIKKAYQNAIKIKDMYELYKNEEQWRRSHKNKIIKIFFEPILYRFTYCKRYDMPTNERCHLIVARWNDGRCCIGYSTTTNGFPRYDGVHPLFAIAIDLFKVKLDVSGKYFCFQQQGKQTLYEFEFQDESMKGKWIDLVFKLRDQNIQIKKVLKQDQKQKNLNDTMDHQKSKSSQAQQMKKTKKKKSSSQNETNIEKMRQYYENALAQSQDQTNAAKIIKEKIWEDYQSLQKTDQEKTNTLAQIRNQNQELKQKYKSLVQESILLQNKNNQIMKQLQSRKQKETQQFIEKQTNSFETRDHEIASSDDDLLSKKNAELQKKNQQLQQKIKQIQDKINAVQSNNSIKNQQIEELKIQLATIRSTLKEKNDNLVNFQQNNIQLQKQLIQSKQLIITYTTQISQLKRKIDNISEQHKKQVQLNDENQKTIKQLSEKNQKNLKELKQTIDKLKQLNKQLEIKAQEYHLKQQEISVLNIKLSEHEKLKQSLQNMRKNNYQKQCKQLREKLQQMNHVMFFHGQLLVSYPEHKLFIKTQVEKIKKNRIYRTSLIYKSDPLNTTTFHKYVDEVPDIVLIVKTETGLFFGAFSEGAIDSNHIANKQGIIMSMTHEKVFPVLQGKRSVTYDSFYLIIGNSEIRLKHGEQKVFCNFGINNGYYSSKGGCVDDLIGEGKERQAKIQGFEVHRVIFE